MSEAYKPLKDFIDVELLVEQTILPESVEALLGEAERVNNFETLW